MKAAQGAKSYASLFVENRLPTLENILEQTDKIDGILEIEDEQV